MHKTTMMEFCANKTTTYKKSSIFMSPYIKLSPKKSDVREYLRIHIEGILQESFNYFIMTLPFGKILPTTSIFLEPNHSFIKDTIQEKVVFVLKIRIYTGIQYLMSHYKVKIKSIKSIITRRVENYVIDKEIWVHQNWNNLIFNSLKS